MPDTSPVPAFGTGMSQEERVEIMVDWFLANFEDPANRTPYESREGGYQWIWGGPYDAREELGGAFGEEVSDEEIEAAAQEVEGRDGIVDWAPARRQGDYDTDPSEGFSQAAIPEDDASSRQIAAEQVARRLDDLEAALGNLRQDVAMIGHNRPPGPIEDSGPVTTAELEEARKSVDDVRAELVKDDPDPEPARKAAGRFRRLYERLKGWALGGAFLGAGMVWDQVKNDLAARAYAKVGPALIDAADAIMAWISKLL